jgi:hypothetical protein
MDGPKTQRTGRWKTLEEAEEALKVVYKRHHPEAWIETRMVSPWEKPNE